MVGTDADAGMVGSGRFRGGSGGWSQQNRSRGFWDMPLTRVQAGRQPVEATATECLRRVRRGAVRGRATCLGTEVQAGTGPGVKFGVTQLVGDGCSLERG